MSRARAMIGRKAGAIALGRTDDRTIGEFDDAVILGRYGETPDDLIGITSVVSPQDAQLVARRHDPALERGSPEHRSPD